MGAPKGLVLFPGAGSSRDHSSLVLLEEQLAPMPVGRIDFPYRRAGRKAPDRTPVLLDCVTDEVRNFALQHRVRTSSVVIGGRSMGGRMCSMMVAGIDERESMPVKGLVLVSYPLHPPAKPENLRIEHLPRITVPVLFVHGTKDPFGSPGELREHAKLIRGPVTFHFVENGRHDLAKKDAEIADAVVTWMANLRRPAG
jgi:predicted alpha/beta-hydrolase family hydrolase